MQTISFKFPSSSSSKLTITANRYTTPNSAKNRSGLTLLLTHCVGAHKEHWEPCLRSIFDSQHALDPSSQIREAWSFDWQNHGEAAILNRDTLEKRPEGISLYEWAKAIETFTRSHHVEGHRDRLVLVGHSAGATAMALACGKIINLVGLVLVEPVIISRELFTEHYDVRMATMNFVVESTLQRRDTWDTSERAFEWMSKRVPWNTWDTRVVRIMTTAGMKPTEKGVILKCDKRQEAASYPEVEAHFNAFENLPSISRQVPVHLVWGEQDGLVLDFIQDSLKEASHATSIRRVPNASHFVVQENPDGLSNVLMDVFNSLKRERSRL